jgi:hypothetical protein
MKCTNEEIIKIKSKKKKKLLIISTEEEYKTSFLNKLMEYNQLIKKKTQDDHEEIVIEYEYNNGKQFQLKIDTWNKSNNNITGIKIVFTLN